MDNNNNNNTNDLHAASDTAEDTLTSSSLPEMGPSDTPAPDYVVAIGASAGGLDALEQLFERLPLDSGAAFVVIQHLSNEHKSVMDTLLGRRTRMPIKIVAHNMPIEPDTVYLIPPGSLMHLEGDHFLLTPKFPRTLSLPIDVFFQSLAASYKEKSVGVVLSGTGSDGTRGAGAINEAGGLLIAQEPENAKFDGMPRSIISTGLVDAILPVDAIADRICAHVMASPRLKLMLSANAETASTEELLEQDLHSIFHLLQQASGINFTDYKPGTVTRRIERRMTVRQVNSLADYHTLLENDATEVHTLRRELLIPVTSFFRDPEAYDALRQQVVEVLLSRKQLEQGIRVWCAGIATGEEAYSLGMLFLEAFDKARYWPALKIFATDIEQANIETASSGIYTESIMAELSPQQLERFFTRRGNQFVVKNELRQCIVFAKHNLLIHPPFTKMDLVVCRNVLIYFKAESQNRVLRRLQFALKPDSFLFLGSSETLGSLHTDFHAVSQRQKIWKVIKSSTPLLDLDGRSSSHYSAIHMGNKATNSTAWQRRLSPNNFVQRGYETLLKAFAPPAAILIGANQELIHSYGEINRFLQFRPGQASLELNRILPDPLIPVASALLFKSIREGTSAICDPVRVHLQPSPSRSTRCLVRLSAWPVPLGDESEDQTSHMTLLVFEELGDATDNNRIPVDVELATSERMEILQHELAATRESLQATIEELETSNEELQATNEEMMASNEELQSSNEELQSVNEELNTVNAEYQEKIEILNRVNADLDNLAKVAASGTIFIDEYLNLTRFSPDATDIFKLRDTDLGRPLSDISHTLVYPNLVPDLKESIRTGLMQQKEVHTSDGKLYLVKMLPYQVASSPAKGLVVNFIDITSMQKASKMVEVLNASSTPFAVVAQNLKLTLINKAWREQAETLAHGAHPCAIDEQLNYLEWLSAQPADWGRTACQAVQDAFAGITSKQTVCIEENAIYLCVTVVDDKDQDVLLELIRK